MGDMEAMEALARTPCTGCGRVGIIVEAMDDFGACLCQACYERLLAEYQAAINETTVSTPSLDPGAPPPTTENQNKNEREKE